jgi:hypothetical protein
MLESARDATGAETIAAIPAIERNRPNLVM